MQVKKKKKSREGEWCLFTWGRHTAHQGSLYTSIYIKEAVCRVFFGGGGGRHCSVQTNKTDVCFHDRTNKLIFTKSQFHADWLCLRVADPATFVASNSFSFFCFLGIEIKLEFALLPHNILKFWVWISSSEPHGGPFNFILRGQTFFSVS